MVVEPVVMVVVALVDLVVLVAEVDYQESCDDEGCGVEKNGHVQDRDDHDADEAEEHQLGLLDVMVEQGMMRKTRGLVIGVKMVRMRMKWWEIIKRVKKMS